jgi:hypothetical protein
MANYTIYLSNTGAIAGILACPVANVEGCYDTTTQGIIEGHIDGEKYYIPLGIITEKIVFPILIDKTKLTADDVDKISITNIPLNTNLTISYSTGCIDYVLEDTLIDFNTSISDIYSFTFTNVQYLPLKVLINAN